MFIRNKKAIFISSLTSIITVISWASPATPHIAWLPASYDKATDVEVRWDMWWGENATSWTLTNNGTTVCQDNLTANGNQPQKGSCTVTLTSGSHELIVKLKNINGETASTPKQILVNASPDDGGPSDEGEEPETPATGLPTKPVINWLASELKPGTHTISWNMWWGENGNHWSLTDNDKVRCKGALTMNGKNAQKGSCSIDLAEGQHKFQILLSNAHGTASSDIKTVTVSDSTDSGSDEGDESDNPIVGSGDTPLYTNFDSQGLRKHQPYTNTTNSVIGSYFVEWGIYGRNYHPADVPAANLTHILYGFIPICGPNDSLKQANPRGHNVLVSQSCQGKNDFEVAIHDKYAAIEKSYPGDVWNQDYKGTFNQFRRIKKAYPNLKVLPSIGGWTLSDPFYYLDDKSKRTTFVNSVVEFLKTYTFFDGVDIDWEFPGGGGANSSLGKKSDGETYVVLMQELREALNKLSKETGKTYELTSAIGASPEKIARVDYGKASQYMDYIFMMTYDYYGGWNGELGHQTGIHAADHAIRKDWTLDGAVKAMEKHHVPGKKLVAGVAMYGRGWQGVSGVEGNNPFTGKGGAPLSLAPENGHWETGVVDYFRIVEEMLGGNTEGSGVNGWESHYDTTAEAPYLWHPQKGQLITYDNPHSAKAKAQYVKSHGLGGTFSWEIDADNGDILNAQHEGFNHSRVKK